MLHKIPVASEVQGVCGMLGLEPLYLACEGTMVIIAPAEQAEKIVETLHQCPYSQNAAIIGTITEENPGKVIRMTEIGTQSLLPQPGGELLPTDLLNQFRNAEKVVSSCAAS